MWPLFRWRMDQFRAKALSDKDGWASDRSVFLDWLRQELRDNGPMAASEIEHEANTRRGPWWGWSDVKVGLETLFRWGEVVSAGRAGFERRYGLAEQMLAPEILDAHVERSEAIRELVLRGVKAHGLGTLDDIADYFVCPAQKHERHCRNSKMPAVCAGCPSTAGSVEARQGRCGSIRERSVPGPSVRMRCCHPSTR